MTPWEWTHAAIGALASAIFLLQTLGMGEDGGDADSPDADFDFGEVHDHAPGFLTRSEERRVGKECRSRWSPYH